MTEANMDRMEAITKGLPTKSAKIRALTDAGGFSRRQIADFLGTIPQHVRNVQVQTTRKAEALPQSTHVEVGAGGRVVIPASVREAMGIKEGDRLVARFADGELKLMSKQLALQRAQEVVRKLVPAGVSLVDELIADRRREAAEEMTDTRKAGKNG
ncbi:MAG: AbrB/MazE/SpoVT family DNA-binding domain-containing protein [Parvibaculum sp.]|uniref:AbrB/MazE/SpoVT family DNA-binding domain-containing protein n=1 Tax=Parvibaculum sp. TaxID=2024848 RepID=UPI00272830CA|nr:AbrB/MazE/SpoVT family DNA-binding domain-containing protein [Parvibaculum sp.]MDO8839979.1 AbrB/MazE/SpoVT family DNA-binding domain-containing protein [Parvibaculum sp.]